MNTNESDIFVNHNSNSSTDSTLHCNIFTKCFNYLNKKMHLLNYLNNKNILEVHESPLMYNVNDKSNFTLASCTNSIKISEYYNLLKNYIFKCKDTEINEMQCKFSQSIFKNKITITPDSFISEKEYENNIFTSIEESSWMFNNTVPIAVGVVLFILLFLTLAIFFILKYFQLKNEKIISKDIEKNYEMQVLKH